MAVSFHNPSGPCSVLNPAEVERCPRRRMHNDFSLRPAWESPFSLLSPDADQKLEKTPPMANIARKAWMTLMLSSAEVVVMCVSPSA